MGTSNTLKFLLLFLSLSFVACSSDDDIVDNPEEGTITSITISANKTSIDLGESVVFTVKGNTGKNVTSGAVISVNGEPIEEDSYTPSVAGTHTVKAVFNDIESDTIEIVVEEGDALTLEVNSESIDVTENFHFKVIYNNAEDVTENSTIYFNDAAITGGVVESPGAGSYEAYATYEKEGITYTTETLSLEVVDRTVFIQHVLIEDYTGTWCGWCPRVAHALEMVEDQTDKAVVVGIHRGSTNPSSGAYDPYNFDAGVLENMINLQGYPTAMLNRTTTWNYPEPSNVSQALNLTGEDADLGLKINSSLNGSNMDITVNVKFGADYSSENLKLVVYVLEDGLVYDQTNYTEYYGGGSVIPDFVHNNVLRESLTNILGDDIPSGDTTLKSTYTKTFNVSVPSNVADPSAINIVAFVVNSNNAAINSRTAIINETQIF